MILQVPEFDWDDDVQSVILSSYFYGLILTHILGGWLSGRVGGKRLAGLCMFLIGSLSMLTPSLARVDYHYVIALRVIQGFFGVSSND